jgi:hypothetical protein
MQISLKTAVAAVLTVGSALAGTASQAQVITNLPTSTGASDLVLFVSDTISGVYFVEDLGTQISSIYSSLSSPTSTVITSNGTFTTPASIGGTVAGYSAFEAADANYTADAAAGGIEYSIMAGDKTSATTVALITTPHTLGLSALHTFTNGNVNTFASGINTFFGDLNTNLTGNVSTAVGWDAPGAPYSGTVGAQNSFISAALGNGAALGTAETMYLFSNNASGTNSDGNAYIGASVDLSSAGVLTVTNAGGGSTVPLPAAVWLLGSGLLGLFGVSRRRASV